jgi:hypothetical protein
MIPMIMRLKIVDKGRKKINLFFPVILIWILLAALLIILLPVALIVALLSWGRGGKLLLAVYPMLGAILWNLSDLAIEIGSRQDNSYFSLYFN